MALQPIPSIGLPSTWPVGAFPTYAPAPPPTDTPLGPAVRACTKMITATISRMADPAPTNCIVRLRPARRCWAVLEREPAAFGRRGLPEGVPALGGSAGRRGRLGGGVFIAGFVPHSVGSPTHASILTKNTGRGAIRQVRSRYLATLLAGGGTARREAPPCSG